MDIFSLAVRGIVNEASMQTAPALIQNLYSNLVKGLEHRTSQVIEESLEICTILFKRFGVLILRSQGLVDKDRLLAAINKQMFEGVSASIRRRASYAKGSFAIVLNQNQLGSMCQALLKRIESVADKADKVINVQCLSLMAKSVGSKLGPYIPQIVPLLQREMKRV